MKINILKKLDGAKEAEGLVVIIDVFRAFSVECFLFEHGVKKIYAVGDVEQCFRLKEQHPDYFCVGERRGVQIKGFEAGNSPSQIVSGISLEGKTVIHTTSAGVQGIVCAKKAEEIITGSLVNARAIAEYIIKKDPGVVSLVCMGLDGVEDTAEDILCAEYIQSIIEGSPICIHNRIASLSRTSGRKFFERIECFPEADFFMCLVPDIFDFVIKADTSGEIIEMKKLSITY